MIHFRSVVRKRHHPNWCRSMVLGSTGVVTVASLRHLIIRSSAFLLCNFDDPFFELERINELKRYQLTLHSRGDIPKIRLEALPI